MKRIIIKLIKIYQGLPLKSHGKCKYIPTCSNYAIDGIFKGIFLTIKRIIKCNPFSKGGIDLVKRRNIWKE